MRIGAIFIVAMVALGLLICGVADGEQSAGAVFIGNGSLCWIFQIMFIGIMTGMICAGDFGEKDLNYEMMNGHSRLSIYLARVILCVGLTSLVATVLAFVPIISTAAVFGWGERISAADICIRLALFFFPFMRIAAFFAMLSFIIKKQAAIITIGFITEMACVIFNELLENKVGYMFGVFNLTELMKVGKFELYNVVPGTGVVSYRLYEGNVDPGLIAGTIIVSFMMTAIYLAAGYAFFRKDDVD